MIFQYLQTCLSLPQSLGIIGGKTNQALYLFGYVGDDILYLDPHTTQKSGTIENKATEEQQEMDNSYHCKYASRMPIINMDPSVAVVGIISINYLKFKFKSISNENPLHIL